MNQSHCQAAIERQGPSGKSGSKLPCVREFGSSLAIRNRSRYAVELEQLVQARTRQISQFASRVHIAVRVFDELGGGCAAMAEWRAVDIVG